MQVVEQPLFAKRKLRVVGIGAGFSNLTLIYKQKHQGDNSYIDLQIYEKNPAIGGTWFENRYPGAACDVPAHIYCFPFAPNPDWSSFYVSAPEILEYINKTADKFGLRENIQLDSKVTSTVWSEEKGKWQITIEQNGTTIEDEADILVNGAGFLNSWKWPEIPGIEKYKGELIHSANWRDIDAAGKRVGLIGNGSTGVQILPQLQPIVASIDSYIRNATWIIPNLLGNHTIDGSNFQYSEEQKQRWREHPEELLELRRTLESEFNSAFPLFLKDSPFQQQAREGFAAMMQGRLGGDTKLAKRLVPNFELGCRRITPGDGYLEALQADNVNIRFEPIVSFDEKGIVSRRLGSTDASDEPKTTEFDIIVCATGFDVSFKPAWTMKGHNGSDLAEIWKDDSEAFLGVFAPEMPNYFTATGPNTPLGSGSIFGMIDATSNYILKWCNKIASEGIKSVTVKPQVLREYNEYSQLLLQRTVWSGSCQSWYKNNTETGKVRAMYPGSLIHFRHMLEAFRSEDFDIVSLNERNRFEFMGNGQTELELTGGQLAFYL